MISKKYLTVVVVSLVLCLVIMFVSLSRVSLLQALPKITVHEYRSNLVALKPVFADENIEPGSENAYNLPDAGMLPSSPFYGFKALRDWLWLAITFDSVEKSKLYMHMADKKMSETVALMSESKTKDAYIALEETFANLQKVDSETKKIKPEQADRAKQIRLQMIAGSRAYEMIVANFTTSVTNTEYDRKQEWLENFSKWNEQFEEEED